MASEIEKAPRLAKTFEDASDSPPMRCQDGALTVPRRHLDAPKHSNTPQSSHYTPPRAPPERPGGARGVPGMPSRRAQDGPRRLWDVILVPFGTLQRAQVASKSYMTGRSCGAFWDATEGPIKKTNSFGTITSNRTGRDVLLVPFVTLLKAPVASRSYPVSFFF